ncbi:MAG TPA: DUF1353 domain-containing protein [Acidimicrobiales bacterium]|nr:DUF1353 domain-containing protein [Acidimicrobiales bacterium]
MSPLAGAEPRFVIAPRDHRPATFVLRRAERPGSFHLVEPFTYLDPSDGPYQVEASNDWTTDFASTPVFALWLVPSDGIHAPAAILHDALGQGRTSPTLDDQVRADEIFRDAMANLGVPLLRRWMMWAAVAFRTIWTRARDMDRPRHWAHALWVVLVFIVLAIAGCLATLDLFDASPFDLPWMGTGSTPEELASGAAIAALATAFTSVVVRPWPMGVVAALAIVPFAFPMVVAAIAYGGYFVAEALLAKILRCLHRSTAAESPPGLPKTLRD